MSDNWIVLIPEQAGLVPPQEKHEVAVAKLREQTPKADAVKVEVTAKVRFEHCGGAFEGIKCPSCGKDVEIEWWQERMDEDFGEDRNFKLAPIKLACCEVSKTLQGLDYRPPQGFARFSLVTMNSNIGVMPKEAVVALEAILGCPLRVIYRRM